MRFTRDETEGEITIIDLAGSEKFSEPEMKQQGFSGEKILRIKKEAIEINKSLSALGRVFRIIKAVQSSAGEIYHMLCYIMLYYERLCYITKSYAII